MANRVLIVVDMLNDFIDERGALYCGPGAKAIVPFIRERIDAYRKNEEPVIYLQDSHDQNDKEFDRFPGHCIAGTWGNEIVAELSPTKGDLVIPKRRFSGFFETSLDDVLKRYGVEEAEVVGVCTNICVMDTVGGLANRDIPVTVPRAGVADYDPEFHASALKRMEQIYGARVI